MTACGSLLYPKDLAVPWMKVLRSRFLEFAAKFGGMIAAFFTDDPALSCPLHKLRIGTAALRADHGDSRDRKSVV